MDIVNDQTGEIVSAWKVYDFPPNFEWSYFLSEFALQLNLPPELFSNLCPTDSRYRPDQRALESGVMRVAHSEKHRLEEKQRATRKMLEDSNEVYIPRWFVFENDE